MDNLHRSTGSGRLSLYAVVFAALTIGCDGDDRSSNGEQDAATDSGSMDSGSMDSGSMDSGSVDSGVTLCTGDAACSDGLYCNGDEQCEPTAADADERGCVEARNRPCAEGTTCDESADECITDGDIDADAGDGGDAGADGHCSGCAELSVPLTTNDTRTDFDIALSSPLDLSGQTLTVRVQLVSGSGGYLQIYATSGSGNPEYGVATGLSDLSTTEMTELALKFTGVFPAGFDVTHVTKVGVRIGSDATTDPLTNPTVVRIDSVTLSGAGSPSFDFADNASAIRINSGAPIAGSTITHVPAPGSTTQFSPLVYDTAAELQVFADNISNANPGTISTANDILSWVYDFPVPPTPATGTVISTEVDRACEWLYDWTLATSITAVVRVTGGATGSGGPRLELAYYTSNRIGFGHLAIANGEWQTLQLELAAEYRDSVCNWGIWVSSTTAPGVKIEIDSIRIE